MAGYRYWPSRMPVPVPSLRIVREWIAAGSHEALDDAHAGDCLGIHRGALHAPP